MATRSVWFGHFSPVDHTHEINDIMHWSQPHSRCAEYNALHRRKSMRSSITRRWRSLWLCLCIYHASRIEAWSLEPLFLQCFDTVGWVFWPIKPVPDMTYNVFGGTLNLAQFIQCHMLQETNSFDVFEEKYEKSQKNMILKILSLTTFRLPPRRVPTYLWYGFLSRLVFLRRKCCNYGYFPSSRKACYYCTKIAAHCMQQMAHETTALVV